MKYNWNTDTLKERIDYLNYLSFKPDISEEMLKEILIDIDQLEYYIECQELNTNYDFRPLLEVYQRTKNTYLDIPYLWFDFHEFARLSNSNYLDIPTPKRNSLSKKDILELTHDFYKQLDKTIYGYFMKNWRKNHINFERYNKDFLGETVFIKSLCESFIRVDRVFTSEDLLTSVHEYGHAISFQINPNNIIKNKDLFTEIESLFFELVASDFFTKSIGPEYTYSKAHYFNTCIKMASQIETYLKLIQEEKKLGRSFISNKELKNIGKIYNISPEEIECYLRKPLSYSHYYLTSYLFAVELYNLYKEDKEKALTLLQKIIRLKDLQPEQYYYNIKRLGFIPNQSMPTFINELKSDVLKYTKKKNNK